MISKSEFLNNVLRHTTANVESIHGISHWQNVEKNGLFLSKSEMVDVDVLTCFAYLHDCKRLNDSLDKGHGARAADFIEKEASNWLELTDNQIELLSFACRYHTEDLFHDNLTVQACYDSDRLDLPRCSIVIDVNQIYTKTAKDFVLKISNP